MELGLGWILGMLSGVLLHSLYQWAPSPLTALLSPTNESVWEHLKLLLYPFVLSCIPGALHTKDRRLYFGACCAGLVCMPPFLLGSYYTAVAGFGLHGLPLEIGLYGAALALGLRIVGRFQTSTLCKTHGGLFVALAGLWWAVVTIFSAFPTLAPIFTFT